MFGYSRHPLEVKQKIGLTPQKQEKLLVDKTRDFDAVFLQFYVSSILEMLDPYHSN